MSEHRRGVADALEGVVGDLRDYEPLVELLPERQAIYQSYPTDDRGYGVDVTITPIYTGSGLDGKITRSNYRIQVTVSATRAWREDQEPNPGGVTAMYRILDRVGDRLDRAPGLPEIGRGSAGGPAPMQVDDNRLAVSNDWQLRGIHIEGPAGDY